MDGSSTKKLRADFSISVKHSKVSLFLRSNTFAISRGFLFVKNQVAKLDLRVTNKQIIN